MAVRAKFKCDSITRRAGWSGQPEIVDITLNPVFNVNAENKEFFAATPTGQIVLGCANPKATEQFRLGQEYYVDFIPAQDLPA